MATAVREITEFRNEPFTDFKDAQNARLMQEALDRVRATFEESTDFTVGLEEEFAIVDPATLELEHRLVRRIRIDRRAPVRSPPQVGQGVDRVLGPDDQRRILLGVARR